MTDKDIDEILLDLAIEFEMPSLASGIYLEFAREGAKRVASLEPQENWREIYNSFIKSNREEGT